MSKQNFATKLVRGLIGLTQNNLNTLAQRIAATTVNSQSFSSEAHRKSFLLADSAHEAATKEFITKHAKKDNILNGLTVVTEKTWSQHFDENSKPTDSAPNIAKAIVKGEPTMFFVDKLRDVNEIVKFNSNQHNMKPISRDATEKLIEELSKISTNVPSR
ncbi:MAG: hypothetical protein ACO2XZ_01690 [Rickettsiales bacterium]